ncbi:MAG: Gfo/Idh/MocA family oxidoreductase [Clostridia bacterium]|nr:Gfo/Idh/MocA family oxidoreductase [Clostridia bacterium]
MSNGITNPVGVGLVGTGFMAKVHSNAYHTMKYMFYDNQVKPRLVSICSEHSFERANEAKERYGFEQGVVGYQNILNNEAVDVVDICSGDASHMKIAMESLKAGKHVVCEKPLAANSQDAKTLYEFAKAQKKFAICGFNYRFIPAVLLAKQLIDSGIMGKPYSFNGSYLQDTGAFEEVPYEKLWYASGPKSSGVSYGIGGHLIDMARFLMGEIAGVSGMTANYNPVRMSKDGPKTVPGEEDAVAVVAFKSGGIGTLRFATIAAGRKNCLRFEISCSKGTLVFNLEEINYLRVFYKETPVKQISGFTDVNVTQVDRDHPFMGVWWPRGHGIGWEHAHINELAYFIEHVAKNEPLGTLAASFYDGYQAARIADAIKESSETGERILL